MENDTNLLTQEVRWMRSGVQDHCNKRGFFPRDYRELEEKELEQKGHIPLFGVLALEEGKKKKKSSSRTLKP